MLLKLIGFELRYHSQQNMFRLGAVLYFLLGLAIANGTPGANIFRDSPFSLTFLTAVMSLGSVIMIALFSGPAILRDREHLMESIVFSTNMTHAQYVVSRFAGLVLASMCCFSMGLVGLYLAKFAPWTKEGAMQGFSVLPYIWSLIVVAGPNLLVGCAVIFATAALTKHSMTTYISGVLLYVLYWAGSMIGQSPIMAANSLASSGNPGLAALLEPYGLIAYMEHTRYWTLTQKNEAYPALMGLFLYNRLFWTGFSLTIFAFTYRFFSFRDLKGGKQKRVEVDESPREFKPFLPVTPTSMNMMASLRIFWVQSRLYFKTMVKGYPFYALLLLWGLLTVVSVLETLRSAPAGVPYAPFTGVFIGSLLEPLKALGSMVVIFYTFDLLFAERSVNMHGIHLSSPVSNAVMLFSRLGALALLIVFLIVYTCGLAMMVQISKGFYDFDLPLYASLFYRAGIPLIGVAALALTIGNFMGNRYMGMGLTAVIAVLFSGIVMRQSVFLEHPMLRFGFTPGFKYSPMVGQAYSDDALSWFLMYMLGISGVLIGFALAWWRRGDQLRRSVLGVFGQWWCAASLSVTLVAGAFLYYQFHIVGDWKTDDSHRNWLASYERTYGQYEDMVTPDIDDVKLNVALYPDERRYLVEGELRFRNNTNKVMDRVLLGIPSVVNRYELSLEDAALEEDDGFDHVWVRFENGMPPGDSRSLTFHLEVRRSGFVGIDPENYVLPQFSYVELDKVLPFFGFDENKLLRNPRAREERGLPVRNQFPPADDHTHIHRNQVGFEAVVSTSEDQEIIMPGRLDKSWREGGRSYARYVYDKPGTMRYALAAGAWQVREQEEAGLKVQAFYAEGHEANVDSLLRGGADTLVYGSEHFSPYQDDILRIVEIPSFSDNFGATAYSNTSFAVENRLYLLDQRKGLDMAYRTMSHEVGHHWWGGQLTPASSAGFAMLTELLAVYTETVVYDRVHPIEDRWQYLDTTDDLYFYLRGYEADREYPLSQVQFQPYIYYFKGAHVVHALRLLMGEAQINQVLASFLRDHAFPAAPVATDLTQRLIEAAPEAVRSEVSELLEEVVTYELRLSKPTRESDGEVSVEVIAQMTRMNDSGVENPEPMSGNLEIGLMANGEMTALKNLTIVPGQTRYSMVVDRVVDEIMIDPRRLKLEADRSDNRAAIRSKED